MVNYASRVGSKQFKYTVSLGATLSSYRPALIIELPLDPVKSVIDIFYNSNNTPHISGTPSASKNTVLGTVSANPDQPFPIPTYTIEEGSDKFSINENNEVIINVDNIAAGTYTFTVKAHQESFNSVGEVNLISTTFTVVIESPYKQINDLNFMSDNGKDPLYLDTNVDAGRIGTVTPTYGNGTESGYGVRYDLTSTKGSNDNSYFSIDNNGVLSITSKLTDARTYQVEVTAYETDNSSGSAVDVSGRSYTKVFSFEVLPKPSMPITGITFTPNYPSGKTEWSFGDTGINASGELTGSLSFSGGTSGVVGSNGKDYQKWEIVDASGNVISDSSFEIVNNELHARKQIAIGTYTLRVKVTDNESETLTQSITITVSQASNIDITDKSAFYEFRLSDGSIADITKWQKENIIIHPKHATYSQMKVDSGSFLSGDQTYTKEGSNSVTLQFQRSGGALTNPVNETLKIDKTDPTITKVEFAEIGGNAQSEGSGIFQYMMKNGADIHIGASDNQSGIAGYKVTVTPLLDNGNIDTSKTPLVYDTPSNASTFTYSITNQGKYLVEIEVTDASGRTKSYPAKRLRISNAQISLFVSGYLNNQISQPYDGSQWTNQSITLKLKASDQSQLSDPQISFDNVSFQPMVNGEYTIPATSSIPNQTYYFKAINANGETITTSMSIKLDVEKPIAPTITFALKTQGRMERLLRMITFDHMFAQEQRATFASTDATSGIDHYEYRVTRMDQDGNAMGNAVSGKGENYDLMKDRSYRIEVSAYDRAGNVSEMTIRTVMIDTKPPTITGVKDKSEYAYYYLPRFIHVEDNESGVALAYYTKDGGGANQIVESIEVMGVGAYSVYAKDQVGNEITVAFKIVPLPSIEEIDGSDESKEIIDQVIKELEEIKDQIDKTEKEEYEKWIEDALEKWESQRKKVIETDDKSARVEGVGDTSFDPKLELIVDDITDSSVPQLPRKAIHVYDVYLQKGNVKVQPDGSIKVYLPYEEEEAPIVYQIDEKDRVSELKVEKEGNYVTFVTDTLYKYAISNTAQEENDNRCPLDGIEINIDSDGDGSPDVNVDLDGDCKADINIDTDGDGQPDVDIDTDLDGKADYNIDIDGDGKPDINIGPINEPFHPSVCKTVNGVHYCSDPYRKPYLNIDTDGDGRPDLNLDLDGDQEADLNIDVDGDLIPDLDIDSDGDGKADINIDSDHDGKADRNLLKLDAWTPDKNVDGKIAYDTMSDLLSRLRDNTGGSVNNGFGDQSGTNSGGASTGDVQKPYVWWIFVLINLIVMLLSYRKVKREKQDRMIRK